MKQIAIFLTTLLLFCITPLPSFAAFDNFINGDFESDSIMWNTGAFCEDAPYSGLRSLKIQNSTRQENNFYIHDADYIPELQLEGNKVYTLSFYTRSSDSGLSQSSPACSISMPSNSKFIHFDVTDLTISWSKVLIRFMVDVPGKYCFSFHFYTENPETVIYIDDFTLIPIDFSPHALTIIGSRSISIPKQGIISKTYKPAVIDKNRNYVTIRNAVIQPIYLPDGVTFNPEDYTISVNESVSPQSEAILECLYSGPSSTYTSHKFSIFFSPNMIYNGDFSDIPTLDNWNADSDTFSLKGEGDNTFLQMYTSSLDDKNTVSVSLKQSFFLSSDVLYVFKAKLKTDTEFNNKNMFTEASIDAENKISIKIEHAGSESWNEILTSIRVPNDGIYTLNIQISTLEKSIIYIDDVMFQEEELKPSKIYFELPLHMSIPNEHTLSLPIPSITVNQENNPLPSIVTFHVSPEGNGVNIKDNTLFVHPDAKSQKYQITASLLDDPSVKQVQTISVSENVIGDGSFETPEASLFWTTATPSVLQILSTTNGIYPSEGSKLGRLTMNGSVSALLSDSVFRYESGKSYVFQVDMQTTVPDINTVVTALVDNAESDSFDDNLVIGQFSLSPKAQHIQMIFTPSETVAGRLMIAFNTPEEHNQQIIILDHFKIETAKVTVDSVTVTGVADLNKNIFGRYRFSSNFGALDSSTFRWLISDTAEGIYMPLEDEHESTLSITSDLLGKYLKFEVTPVSLQGPVIGESNTSSPLWVGAPAQSDSTSSESVQDDIHVMQTESQNTIQTKPVLMRGDMRVVDLNKFKLSEKHRFLDLDKHWAKNDIEILAASGVIQGRGNGLFSPDALITRAEFCAFIARAFELAPIYYDGPFTDIKSYNWYAGAVAVLTKHGIAQGVSETAFCPELPITREEMAVIIMRAYRKTSAQSGYNSMNFSDEIQISPWAKADVNESSGLMLINGFPDGNFKPKQNTTRAEAAVTIKRMLTILADHS